MGGLARQQAGARRDRSHPVVPCQLPGIPQSATRFAS
jgi:hypothetical protein